MRIYNRGFRAESVTGAPIPGAHVTLWDAPTGGNLITAGIQDATGGTIPGGLLVCDAWGYAPSFQDTMDRPDLWAIGSDTGDIPGVQRVHLEPDDTDDRVTALETLVAGLTTSAPDVYAYDYGYRGNGQQSSAAANTAAIQNALNALGAAGGTVVLPPGYGYITAPGITLPSRCGLRGAGHYATVLVLASGSNCHMIQNHVSSNGTTDPNSMFVEISDLGLDGAGAYQTGVGPYYGIYINTNPTGTQADSDLAHDATNRITNVYTRNTHDEGIYHDGRSDSVIRDCKVSFAGSNAYTIRFDTKVISCVAEKPAKAGFNLIGSNAMLANCKAYACGQDSSAFNGQAAVPNSGHGFVVTGGGIGEVQMVNCDAQQVSGHGFWLQSGSLGTVISGCSVGGASWSNGTSFVAYNIETSTCVVQGTSLASTGVAGLRLASGADGNDISLTHTSLAGNTAGPSLSADTVTLANRIFVNGLPAVDVKVGSKKIVNLGFGSGISDAAAFGQVSPVQWAPSTAYVAGQLISYLGFVYQVTAAFTSGATFNLANKTMISAPMIGTVVPSGQYVFAGGAQSTGTSATLTNNTLRVSPFYLAHDATLTRIGAEITAAGQAGSKYRLGIYADTGSYSPGALVVDAGQIAGDVVAMAELTISQAMTRGVYWAGGAVQLAATTQPTIRTYTPTAPSIIIGATAPGVGAGSGGLFESTTVSAGLPANFTAAGPAGTIPRIHIKG